MLREPHSCDQVVAIEDESRHHLVIANEFVRAFAVEIAPRDRTLCHRHPNDYLLYVAGDAEIVSAARDEDPKKLSYRDGDCELSMAGLVHVVENLRDTPFRNVVVELMPAVGALQRGANPVTVSGEASIALLLNDDRAAIFSIEIEPGAEIRIGGPAVVATSYGNRLNPGALHKIELKANVICDLGWIPGGVDAALWSCWRKRERVIVFQVGRIYQESSAVLKPRDPMRTLRAHADEE